MFKYPSHPDQDPLRFQLTKKEEEVLAVTIKRTLNQGRPLRRTDVADAVELLVECFTKDRQNRICFHENSPGPEWI